mgnify:FL=1
MDGKKGQAVSPFMLITVGKFAIGVLVALILLIIVMNLVSPDNKAEEASKRLFEDITIKVRQIAKDDSIITTGFLDKDIWLIGIDSEQRLKKDGKLYRPNKCGATSLSCICVCKDEVCQEALECKGYSSKRIKNIYFTGDEPFDANKQDSLHIKGEKKFTARIRLQGDALYFTQIPSKS